MGQSPSTTASTTAELSGLSIRSTHPICLKIRDRIAEHCEFHSPLQGAVKIDDSYLGTHRVRGISSIAAQGRGACGKTIVFCLLKRQDKVYTEPRCKI